ncbi:MAG: hypothetical protein R2752_13620 [Vicinamibacterales bacterium]
MRRYPSLAALLLAGAALSGCATTSALQRAQAADRLRDYDLAVAEYTEAVRQHPDDYEARVGLDRARLRASQAHHQRGRQLYAQRRYQEAILELQIANETNPTSPDVERDLRLARAAMRDELSRPPEGQTTLEALLARAPDLRAPGPRLPAATLPGALTTGRQTTSRELYQTLGALMNLSVTFDPQFRETPAEVALEANMPLDDAMAVVGRATGTFIEVTAPAAITVVNDTAGKRREYMREAERVIPVQNADLTQTIDALRIVNDARAIAPIPGINALVLRDTEDRLAAASRFVLAFDKARPEVMIDVEVLEVNRETLREYGAQIASPGSPGIDGSLDANREGLSLESLRSLSRADILTGGIPALYYRLLKTDSRTQTLANSTLRVTDGVEATAQFGERVPVPVTVIQPITQGGLNIQPQTSYNYETIGVNLTITPRAHANDDISLALDVELSSLSGTGYNGLPSFGNRHVTTTLRLRDGETNILAGLIRDDERTARENLPGLGTVPVLGKLFGRNRREAEQTDVVVMLTPHIIRGLTMSEADLTPYLLPRESSGAAILNDPGMPPPQPPRAGGGGGGGEPDAVEAPRAEPVEAPRAEPVEAPRAEPVEAPRAEPVEAPRAEPVEAQAFPVGPATLAGQLPVAPLTAPRAAPGSAIRR